MKDRMRFDWLLGAVVLFGLGVFGGLRLAPEGAEVDDPHAGHDHGEEEADDHADLDDADFARLDRLGVRIGAVELVDFTATTPVNAVVESIPESHRIVHAPIGGRVIELHVASHERVEVGDPVVTLLRAPLPRPSLTITANVLTPAQESLHEAVRDLRRRALEVEIVSAEIERVEGLQEGAPDGLPVVSPQRLVDLRYDLARAETSMLGAREEAEKHGLTDEQIAAVIGGEHGPAFDSATWRAALMRNGLWIDLADALYDALPRSVRSAPWAVATIGELVASGLAEPRLVEWLSSDASAAEHFLDIGVLLQRGHTLDDLQAMHLRGSFEPVVVVRVPESGSATSFDVDRLHVQPGATVEAGEPLADLDDLTRVRLAIEGIGSERALLARALATGARLSARPVMAGVGPDLSDVALAYVRGTDGASELAGSRGYAIVENQVAHESGSESAAQYRTWALRPGMRYVVHLPTAQFDEVFVLPAGAITRHEGEPAVVVRHGGHFDPHPVALAYRDDRYAVIEPSPSIELEPGDSVVLEGVLEMLQALNAGNEAIDAHAGHSH